MKKNLKVLGLALVAIMAMSAVISAVAQAESPTFVLTAATGKFKGSSNDHIFTVQGGNVKCVENGGVKGARFEGTLTAEKSTEVTVTAAYGNAGKGCTAFGVAATVNMKSCHYRFTAVKGSNPPTALVDVICTTAGDEITVTASSLPCTVTVGPQTGLIHALLTNAGPEPTHVNAEITVGKIKYTASGVGCPKPGTFEDGSYTGTVTLEGFDTTGKKVGLHIV